MGMMIGTSNSGIKTITFKNTDGTSAGSIGITGQSKKKKKKINYNFKEISARIMNAKTSGNSRSVTAMARSKIAILRQKLTNTDYDDKELKSALAHALRMEEISIKKTKNLQQEEQIKKQQDKGCNDTEKIADILSANGEGNEEKDVMQKLEELEKQMKEYEKLIEQTEQMQENNSPLEEIVDTAPKDMSPDDLSLLKKKHRAEEMKKIMEADLHYLKAMFDRLAEEKQAVGNGVSSFSENGVSLELVGMEIPVQLSETPVLQEGGVDITV